MCILRPLFFQYNQPEVTLCVCQGVKIQLLAYSVEGSVIVCVCACCLMNHAIKERERDRQTEDLL